MKGDTNADVHRGGSAGGTQDRETGPQVTAARTEKRAPCILLLNTFHVGEIMS